MQYYSDTEKLKLCRLQIKFMIGVIIIWPVMAWFAFKNIPITVIVLSVLIIGPIPYSISYYRKQIKETLAKFESGTQSNWTYGTLNPNEEVKKKKEERINSYTDIQKLAYYKKAVAFDIFQVIVVIAVVYEIYKNTSKDFLPYIIASLSGSIIVIYWNIQKTNIMKLIKIKQKIKKGY